MQLQELIIDVSALAQVLNILTLGSGGKGGFLPSGPNGRIKTVTPLNPTVPSNLLAEANAPYVVVTSQQGVHPLQPAAVGAPVASTAGG